MAAIQSFTRKVIYHYDRSRWVHYGV